jgi:hypothetical protein
MGIRKSLRPGPLDTRLLAGPLPGESPLGPRRRRFLLAVRHQGAPPGDRRHDDAGCRVPSRRTGGRGRPFGELLGLVDRPPNCEHDPLSPPTWPRPPLPKRSSRTHVEVARGAGPAATPPSASPALGRLAFVVGSANSRISCIIANLDNSSLFCYSCRKYTFYVNWTRP